MEAQPLSAEEAVPPQEADPEPETQTQPANSEGTPPHSVAKTMQQPATTLLPLGGDEFPDEVLAVVCRFLGLADLGRLARVSRRFSERTLTELGDESGSGVLSAIEEGARVQVAGICGRNGTLGVFAACGSVGASAPDAGLPEPEQGAPGPLRTSPTG